MQSFDDGHVASLLRAKNVPGQSVDLLRNLLCLPTLETDESIGRATGILPCRMKASQHLDELVFGQSAQSTLGEGSL